MGMPDAEGEGSTPPKEKAMGSYTKHLYVIMHPSKALIASQLEPEEFGRYYSIGASRHYQGKLLFVEIDIGFRNPYFEIDHFLEQTVEHDDGRPKHSKFIKSYRVLEHVDLDAMGPLYATTAGGETLKIERKQDWKVTDPGRVRLFQELNPLHLLVASSYDQREFGALMTSPENPLSFPKLFFTQLDLDVSGFLADRRSNPFTPSPVPGVHPQKLEGVLQAVDSDTAPRTKSIGGHGSFDGIPFGLIRHGFWLAAGSDMVFYPMPSQDELRSKHRAWWRTSS